MLPWYYQIMILVSVAVIAYPIVVLLLLKYYYFPSLMRSVVDECFKLEKEKEELPLDENPLETGDCKVVMGNIVRKDDEDDGMTEDQLREYFWG